jgi:AGCS family alanine or glycine:cation symporter
MAGEIAARLSEFVWNPVTICVILAVGLYFSVGTHFFQITKIKLWFGETIVGAVRSSLTERRRRRRGNRSVSSSLVKKQKEQKGISPFQSVTIALAGAMGTGNIAGVAIALAAGGAGAIFWMWVAAVLGMMTSYAETVLGVVFRKKGSDGKYTGGPMNYMEDGLKMKPLAVVFAAACVLCSFGIGNITQINSAAQAAQHTLSVPPLAVGVVSAAVIGFILIGGITRLARFTEIAIPIISAVYFLGCIVVLTVYAKGIPSAFAEIFSSAFNFKAVGGGAAGALAVGIKRGVFTNEAGMGSSVIAHSCADSKSPAHQGMWGIFGIFADTIVVCTLTALVILTTGVLETAPAGSMVSAPSQIDGVLTDGISQIYGAEISGGAEKLDGAAISAEAFSRVFGGTGGVFVALSLVVFAFSTLVAWSCYGEVCFRYLFKGRGVIVYRLLFVAVTIVGSVAEVSAVWDISDALCGLMMIPNIIAVVLLSPRVFREGRRLS